MRQWSVITKLGVCMNPDGLLPYSSVQFTVKINLFTINQFTVSLFTIWVFPSHPQSQLQIAV